MPSPKMPELPDAYDEEYWGPLREWGKKHSDGCTGVPDFFRPACDEHDWHWRYGVTLFGEPIDFDQSNQRFKQSIRALARKGLSLNPGSWWRVIGFPMSRWRRAAVSTIGRRIWTNHRRNHLRPPFLLPPNR